MNKVIVYFRNPTATWSNMKEVDAAIETLLVNTFGEEFLFEFDVWWRETCLSYSVYNYSKTPWSTTNKTMDAVWESTGDLTEFVNYFFNHDYTKKFFLTLNNNGWTVTGPKDDIE